MSTAVKIKWTKSSTWSREPIRRKSNGSHATTWNPASQQPTRTAISASYTYVTDSSLWRHLQRLALDMSSVVTLYVVDYDSMVSGPVDHLEGWHWRGKIDFDVNVGHVSFNMSNIGTGNVYSFPMRAGSSYSELMERRGYTDVHKRETSSVLCSGGCTVWWWICDGLGRYLWPTVDRPYCQWRKSYRSPSLVHGGRYWNMFFVVKFIHLRYDWSYMKSHWFWELIYLSLNYYTFKI